MHIWILNIYSNFSFGQPFLIFYKTYWNVYSKTCLCNTWYNTLWEKTVPRFLLKIFSIFTSVENHSIWVCLCWSCEYEASKSKSSFIFSNFIYLFKKTGNEHKSEYIYTDVNNGNFGQLFPSVEIKINFIYTMIRSRWIWPVWSH